MKRDWRKRAPAQPCEVRETLRAQVEAQKEWGPKRSRLLGALFTHEKKHGCGERWISVEDVNVGDVEGLS